MPSVPRRHYLLPSGVENTGSGSPVFARHAHEAQPDGRNLQTAGPKNVPSASSAADVGPLLVVTHAFVIGWFVRSALDAPIWQWIGLSSANTGLSVIRYAANGAALVTFNDTGHLLLRRWPETGE
jgi:hypothetical protein